MANYVNWLQEDMAEFYSESHFGSTEGAAPNIGDNNLSTRFAATYACGHGQCPVVRAGVEVTINFSRSNIIIDKIEFTIQTEVDVAGNSSSGYDVQIYDGTWHLVSASRSTGHIEYQIVMANFSEYSNVSAIKIALNGAGATEWRGGGARASIYEIKAWGNNYLDIGLRAYDGSGIVKIACEPVGVLSTPLRIYKNGITYSIVLVDPSDYRASKIKIRTNSGAKALAKIN